MKKAIMNMLLLPLLGVASTLVAPVVAFYAIRALIPKFGRWLIEDVFLDICILLYLLIAARLLGKGERRFRVFWAVGVVVVSLGNLMYVVFSKKSFAELLGLALNQEGFLFCLFGSAFFGFVLSTVQLGIFRSGEKFCNKGLKNA